MPTIKPSPLWALWVLAALGGPAAWAHDDIVDVLRHSQEERLAAFPDIGKDSERPRTLHATFDRLVAVLKPARTAELRVVRGPVVAETVHGHVILVNESVAAMPEDVRLFILAHELGHVQLQHWLQTAMLYQKFVPGTVTPGQTDAVAAMLGREASALAYQHEFAADAFAAQSLRAMGRPMDRMLAVFQTLGMTQDTPTHPGTRKRIASLRALPLEP